MAQTVEETLGLVLETYVTDLILGDVSPPTFSATTGQGESVLSRSGWRHMPACLVPPQSDIYQDQTSKFPSF